MPFTQRTTHAGGRSFRYLDAATAGATPRGTIVLLHAFPLNARMWEPQLPLTASGWRIVAPQFRQVDGGDDEPAATSIDDYADDVVRLVRALGLSPAIVGGLSMGGYVAFAIMRRAPELVRALVLADTRPQADSPDAVEGRKKMLGLVNERGASAVADEMIPRLLGDTTRAGRPDIVAHVRELVLANSSGAIAGAITALMTRPDSTPTLAAITCPTCVIVGAEDRVTLPAVADEMHRALSGSQLSQIAAAGHLSNVERPDAFNRVLGRFLDTLPPR